MTAHPSLAQSAPLYWSTAVSLLYGTAWCGMTHSTGLVKLNGPILLTVQYMYCQDARGACSPTWFNVDIPQFITCCTPYRHIVTAWKRQTRAGQCEVTQPTEIWEGPRYWTVVWCPPAVSV
jgi:hypothetical protein